MLSKSIVVAGADPGSTNFGFAVMRFKGLLELTDAVTGAVVKTVPLIEPLAMHRWDVKKGVYTGRNADDTEDCIDVRVCPAPDDDRLCDYAPLIGRFVGRVKELYETHDSMLSREAWLPIVVTENQFDHIKSAYAKAEMLVLSHAFRAAVVAVDAREPQSAPWRSNMQTGLKYGLRNDNAMTRPERKAKSDEIVRELFRELGLTAWSRWLERMDAAKQQTHDMCDALLLAVQEAINRYEQLARAEIRQRRALIKAIPKTPTVKRARKPKEAPVEEDKMARTKGEAATFFAQLEQAELDDDHPVILAPRKGRTMKEADKPPLKKARKKAVPKAKEPKKRDHKAEKARREAKQRDKVLALREANEEPKKRKRDTASMATPEDGAKRHKALMEAMETMSAALDGE